MDRYRTKLMERLKASRSISAAYALVEQANRTLARARLPGSARERFWQDLHENLDALSEEARLLADRQAGVKLAARVVAARALATRYRDDA